MRVTPWYWDRRTRGAEPQQLLDLHGSVGVLLVVLDGHVPGVETLASGATTLVEPRRQQRTIDRTPHRLSLLTPASRLRILKGPFRARGGDALRDQSRAGRAVPMVERLTLWHPVNVELAVPD